MTQLQIHLKLIELISAYEEPVHLVLGIYSQGTGWHYYNIIDDGSANRWRNKYCTKEEYLAALKGNVENVDMIVGWNQPCEDPLLEKLLSKNSHSGSDYHEYFMQSCREDIYRTL